ncbi:MAG: Sensor histidine kinase [Planctomycetaceae bacterium]|nr:Sensor histidine kinase [Planctomycetaceae bacterium]
MRRPVFAWLIFGVCLLSATAAVGWLTQLAWRSDQARQQALLESEVRNALWRLDSLVAPLLAIEITRPSFSTRFLNTPVLASTLVKGYVLRDADGRWTIRTDGRTNETRPLTAECPLVREDWIKKLDSAQQLWQLPTGPTGSELHHDGSLNGLIVWPDPQQNEPGIRLQQNVASPQIASRESQTRNQLVQQLTQIAVVSQQQVPPPVDSARAVAPLHAIWVGQELVLARRVMMGKSRIPIVELCWLNWVEWEALLNTQLDGLSTRVRLVPDQPDRLQTASPWQMVSLPIRLIPVQNGLPAPWPLPLFVVWGLLFIVALAFGWLMWATLSLSERRAAFVSAVTHELRTPLTTFRLYTEMLSEGLVNDPDQRQTYFQTLNREANRLTHLVENVLAFARLEHGRSTARNETLTLGDLFDRCLPRLEQRVAETSLSLVFHLVEPARSAKLTTNAVAVEQILFNLIDNSCKYASDATDPRILCRVEVHANDVSIQVRDFGRGLSAAARRTLFQPFQKSSSQAAESAPGIGLGLALSHRLARDLRGSLNCRINSPSGLSFELRLPLD